MKASGKSLLTIAALIILVNLVVAVLFDQLIMPLLIPSGTAFAPADVDSVHHRATAICFVLGTFVSAVILFLYSTLTGRQGIRQDVLDAVPRPVLVVDEGRRTLMLNSEAEKALGLSRERDLGKTIGRDIESAIVKTTTDGVTPLSSLLVKGDKNYRVSEHPLPEIAGVAGRCRLIVLDSAEETIRVHDAIHRFQHDLSVLDTSTDKIVNASQSLYDGATRQAGSLSAISSSLDEFSKKIQGNTEAASKGNQLAAQAREAAERSGSEIAFALSAMTDVQDAGVRIARIVKLIDDIAFQTNLLALNAAVEAARAGRQGKGFAVVADEVRNLAGRSAKAAKDTAVMVEDVTERIGNASAYISKLEEMLRNIMQDAIRLADSSAVASDISIEQASAILQVNRELGQMNDLTQRTKADAERTASAVNDLAKLVDDVKLQFARTSIYLGLAGENRSLPAESEFEYDMDHFQPALEADTPNGPAMSTVHNHSASSFLNDLNDMGEDIFSTTTPSSPSTPASPYRGGNPNDTIPLPDVNGGSEDDFSEDDFVAPFKRMAALRDLQEGIAPQRGAAGAPVEYSTNKDGDRVVRPGQQIQLDDTEFGRY